jgi:hypothetical protein
MSSRTAPARTAPAFFFALALTIICCAPSHANSVTIDDSGTQALDPSVSMRWKTATPARSATDNVMIGTTTIRVRINVMPWLKHSGRIYLSLPAQQPGPIRLSWITQGRFLPGQVQSGNRTLIYSGPITAPFMEDTLTLQFVVDGSHMQRAVPVTYHFEMDES